MPLSRDYYLSMEFHTHPRIQIGGFPSPFPLFSELWIILWVILWHKDGFAPLHLACMGTEKRHSRTVEVLLRAGADPELKTRGPTGQTPIELCKNTYCKALLSQALQAVVSAQRISMWNQNSRPFHPNELVCEIRILCAFYPFVMINIALNKIHKTTHRPNMGSKFPKFPGNYVTRSIECNIILSVKIHEAPW